MSALHLDFDTCDRARLARDHAFDGRFVTAVKTTRIYCRPVCPARPLSKNIAFYATGAEAERAGFRACKRCKPQLASAAGEPQLVSAGDEPQLVVSAAGEPQLALS